MLTFLQGELATTKEAHASQTAGYEKEIRKARKEAFKTSSAVVKLQEELKAARSGLRKAQQDRDLEQQRAQQKEQERFELEYQLIQLQEELTKLEGHMKAAQEETLALKANLKEEEVARIAAEGRIPLPPSQDFSDEFASPRKQSPIKRAASPLSDDKENMQAAFKKSAESRRMAEALERERMRREHAEELAEFLQMECNFRCCACKRASRLGHELSLSLDDALNEGILKVREGMQSILATPVSLDEPDAMDVEQEPAVEVADKMPEPEIADQAQHVDAPEKATLQHAPATDDVDRSMTFTSEPTRPATDSTDLEARPADEHVESEPAETTSSVPLQPSTPPQSSQHHDTTPFRRQPSIRTVTTTTTIPMHFTPVAKQHLQSLPVEDAENVPPTVDPNAPTFDRAAALAAIEYRRGRAKSLANGTATPRKQMMEGVAGRRDISAPALGQKSANAGAGSVKVIGSASEGRAPGRRPG